MIQRENGVLIGTVVDLKDPEKLGRVKLKFPQYDDQPSDWARVASPMAGKDRGFFFRPEVGDEVLVALENGDPRRAYVLGALWSKVDTPPEDDANAAENNWRTIRSREGQILRFDDTKGKEKIEILGKNEMQTIVIDFASSKIEITCTKGDLSLSAPTGTLKLDAKTIEIKASADATVQANTTLTLKGTTAVNIN